MKTGRHTPPPRGRMQVGFMASRKGCDYLPFIGSDAWRVLTFFIANRDEELSTTDITAKFDVGTKHVWARLQLSVGAGYLTKKVVRRQFQVPINIYAAGPQLAKAEAAMAAQAAHLQQGAAS